MNWKQKWINTFWKETQQDWGIQMPSGLKIVFLDRPQSPNDIYRIQSGVRTFWVFQHDTNLKLEDNRFRWKPKPSSFDYCMEVWIDTGHDMAKVEFLDRWKDAGDVSRWGYKDFIEECVFADHALKLAKERKAAQPNRTHVTEEIRKKHFADLKKIDARVAAKFKH